MTSSACTVRPHHVLLETAYTNTFSYGPGGGAVINFPQAILRLGTFDSHLEYDLTFPSAGKSSIAPTVNGTNDIGLGVTYEMGYSERWLYGVNTLVTLPTGSKPFTAGKAQWTWNFNAQYFVAPNFALAGTTGFNVFSGSDPTGAIRTYSAMTPSLAAVLVLRKGLAMFAQYGYQSADGPGLAGRSTDQVGIVRLVDRRHALVYLQYGISPAAPGSYKQGAMTAGLWVMY